MFVLKGNPPQHKPVVFCECGLMALIQSLPLQYSDKDIDKENTTVFKNQKEASYLKPLGKTGKFSILLNSNHWRQLSSIQPPCPQLPVLTVTQVLEKPSGNPRKK